MKKPTWMYFWMMVVVTVSSCQRHPQKDDEQYFAAEVLDTIKQAPTSSPGYGYFSTSSLAAEISNIPISVGSVKYKHKRIEIAGNRYYLVEGDLLLNEQEYSRYRLHLEIQKIKSEFKVSPKLIGEIRDGRVVRMPENMVIKYAVIKNSFLDNQQYTMVRDNMKSATRDWESTCNVKFFHDEAKDTSMLSGPSGDLTFIVVAFDASGEFIACSFFPYDPPERRTICVDPSYFSTGFDKIGVFRHELGHTLGFRHEHISPDAPAACPSEVVSGTINLTSYDPQSVMHYFCGGSGNMRLTITDIDKKGSQYVYGPPKQ